MWNLTADPGLSYPGKDLRIHSILKECVYAHIFDNIYYFGFIVTKSGMWIHSELRTYWLAQILAGSNTALASAICGTTPQNTAWLPVCWCHRIRLCNTGTLYAGYNPFIFSIKFFFLVKLSELNDMLFGLFTLRNSVWILNASGLRELSTEKCFQEIDGLICILSIVPQIRLIKLTCYLIFLLFP